MQETDRYRVSARPKLVWRQERGQAEVVQKWLGEDGEALVLCDREDCEFVCTYTPSSVSETGGEKLPVLCRRSGLWPNIQPIRTCVATEARVAGQTWGECCSGGDVVAEAGPEGQPREGDGSENDCLVSHTRFYLPRVC